MAAVNVRKIFVGGLVAAVVMLVVDGATFFLFMREAVEANAARLGLDPAAMTGAAGMVGWVAMEIIWGMLVVFTYAGIRPRFGPGPRTAVIAGLIPWIAVFTVMFSQTQGGFMTMPLFWQGALLGLVAVIAGTVAGAWVYTEA